MVIEHRIPPSGLACTLAATLATWLSVAPALADHCPNTEVSGRPRIGLVLGGGGARGFAHVGVLQRLEELRIPYDFIAGTSMGSIVGGFAATGMTAEEIADLIRGADWDRLFTDASPRDQVPARRKSDDLLGLYGPKIGLAPDAQALPAGVVAGQNILYLFESAIAQHAYASDFDDLPVPFRATSTDLVTGELVVLKDGSLSGAMRASMAVPGVFDPVPAGDRLLVDGGLARNLPVDVARSMGADVVIAVDVGTPLLPAHKMKSAFSIIEQFTSLLTNQNTLVQVETLDDSDVLIRPQLGEEITSASFDDFEQALPLGYAAAVNAGTALDSLSVSEDEYRQWRAALQRCMGGPTPVEFVRLDNQSRFSDEVIRKLVTVQTGVPVDEAEIRANLDSIYSLGFIRLARYRMVEENGRKGIEIEVLEDQRGTDLLETGVTVTGNSRSTSFNLQAAYLKTDIDHRGSEFRGLVQIGDNHGVEADLYKYLDDTRSWYLVPGAYWTERSFLVFSDSTPGFDINLREGGVGLRLGREFNRHAQLSLGVKRFSGKLDVSVGLPLPGETFDGGEWDGLYVWDSLDDLFLPTRGTRALLRYIASDEALGADVEFSQLEFFYLSSYTWGLHSMQLVSRLNTSLDDEIPDYALFTAGGFLNMSGYEPNELLGEHFGMVGVGYRYQLGKSGLLPGYAGITIEYGNAAEERSDVFGEGLLNGSVYLGYNTPLGPLYVGYGYAEDRSGVLFLSLGSVLGGSSVGRR